MTKQEKYRKLEKYIRAECIAYGKLIDIKELSTKMINQYKERYLILRGLVAMLDDDEFFNNIYDLTCK